MKVFYLFSTLCFFSTGAWSQDIIMHSGTISTCGGYFYDTGTDTSLYSINENYVLTICSDVPGQCVSVQFTSFALENNFDFLYVYNGPNAGSPLIGTYTGNTSPGTVTATSGCLTIKFVSDYTVCKAGWTAQVTCSQCPVNGCPACSGGLPPANDACAAAENIGALPAPLACPVGTGQLVTINTTNLCATPEIPYNALQSCNPVGNMATPASDVWYRFSITGPILNVTINGMITPEVGLYSGTGCNNLVPRGCAIGGGGLLNTSFSGLAPGQYFLRVSGGTLTDQCNFTLSLQNNLDCQGCVIQSSFIVTPPPSNGIYLAGQSVNFCLQITAFNPTSANWLHAVIPTFGDGWDMSTLSFNPPSSCSGNGNWDWYNQIITSSANSGFTAGPGFFYETAAGNPGGIADADPGNNFGDNLSSGCTWNFCFSIQTNNQANCINGENLNVFIDTYGDGETGSWTSVACSADPVNDFYAGIACCTPPIVSVNNPDCNGQTGTATGTGSGSGGPWTFTWKDAAGTIIRQISGVNNDQVPNLDGGTNTLITTDASGCEATTVFVIAEPPVLLATIILNDTKCALNNGVITVTPSGGSSPYDYSNNNGSSYQFNSVFDSLAPGTYQVLIRDDNGCMWDTTLTVDASTNPVVTNVNTLDITCYNASDGEIVVTGSGGTPPYEYSLSSGQGPQSSPTFDQLVAGSFVVTISDQFGCTAESTVVLNQPPPANVQIIPLPTDCGLNTGSITLNVLSGTTGTVNYSITGGQVFQTSNTFTMLPPGIYIIVIEDGGGCLTYDTAIVNSVNSPIINSLVFTDLSCYQSSNGSITVAASGGVGALQYSIDNGTTFLANGSFTGLAAGTYRVVVRDQNNCRVNRMVILIEPPNVSVYAALINTACGMNNGQLTLTPTSGTQPFQYSTDGGTTWFSSPVINNLPAGPLAVIIMDANGCTRTRNYNVSTSSGPGILSLNLTDVQCYGGLTGEAVINTTGGTPPLQYSIDNGLNFYSNNLFAGLAAGSYTLIVKDSRNCRDTSVFTINQPPQIVLATNFTDAVCGLSNGTINASVAGGSGAFTFSSDGGLTFGSISSFSGLPSGAYKIVAMDANGCTEAVNITIGDALGPRITAVVTTPQICDDTPNGSVDFTVVAGTGVLEYSLDSGNTFQSASAFANINAGDYFMYVQDVNGCRDSALVNIGIYHSPSIDLVSTSDITCFGFDNGTLSVAASGGNGQITYSIDGGGSFINSNAFDSLVPSTYLIAITDTNNCMAFDTVDIDQPPLLISSSSAVSEKCDRNDGSIQVQSSGGIPGYLYNLNNTSFVPDSNFVSLDSGLYQVMVMDQNGCFDSSTIQVPYHSAPAFSSILESDIPCYGASNGSIIINASGNGPFLYSIDGFNFDPSNVFNSLPPNAYVIVVTDSNNCRVDSSATIMEPPPINFNFQSVSASCSFNNGSVTISAVGGSGTLLFDMNHSGSFTTDSVFSNLVSGNYTITIRDSLGCEQDFTASVNNLNGPIIQSVNSSNIDCFGLNSGNISINAIGGSGTLSFSIDNGATYSSQTNYTSLPAGTYQIMVLDSIGCTATNTVTITQPPVITVNHQVTAAACGQSNGSITLVANGGSGTLTYSIDGINFQTSPVFANLPAAGYMLYVRDANNCLIPEPVTINNLLAPSITSTMQLDLNCYADETGEIIVYASGGTGSLSYSIDNGVTFQTSGLFDSLSSGTYFIVVSDQNNCVANSILQLNQPDSVSLSPVLANETCSSNNATISLSANGGISPFSYSINGGLTFSSQQNWSALNAGLFDIAVRDAHGCLTPRQVSISDLASPVISGHTSTNLNCFGINDGSIQVVATGGSGILQYSLNADPPQSTSLFNNLSGGNYIVTVTDTNSCTDSIHVAIVQPPLLAAASSHDNPLCNSSSDGSAEVVVSGGTPNYSIQWSNGAGNNFSLANIPGGIYYYTITDANGCTFGDSVLLTAPLVISISHTISNASCSGSASGSASVAVTGGTSPYQYSWSPVPSNTYYLNNITAGTYTVVVTDAHSCTQNYSVTVTDPAPVLAQVISHDVSCYGGSDGFITATPAGGLPPYTYAWDYLTVFDSIADGLSVGNYTVVVTDNSGCTFEESVSLSSPPQLMVVASINDASCFDYTDGSVTVTPDGGVPPYQYNWSDGSSSATASGLSYGNYTVVVTDAHGCERQVSYHIAEPSPVLVTATIADTLCIGQSATLTSIASGGTGGSYSYLWSNGGNSQDIQVSPAISTIYTIIANDSNGCASDADTSSIFVHPPLQATISGDAVICEGDSVPMTVVATGGNGGPYFYSWNATADTQSTVLVYPVTTMQIVSVISDNCTVLPVADSALVIVNPAPVINFTMLNAEGCVPITVSFINQTITPPGSVYSWNFGEDNTFVSDINPMHVYTESGDFDITLSVTTPEQCNRVVILSGAVHAHALPLAEFNADQIEATMYNPRFTFSDQSELASQWIWDFGDQSGSSYEQNPVYVYRDTGHFIVQLIVSTEHQCFDTSYREVIISGEYTLFIPNAFTPNGDGINDFFAPLGFDITEMRLTILNRWGEAIFSDEGLDARWNGKWIHSDSFCKQDVYVYKIITLDMEQKHHEYIGHVTLVR